MSSTRQKWFLDKAEQSGFRVLEKSKELELDISSPVFHKFGKNGHEGTIVGVDFKGVLEVTNRQLFIRAFEKGIGRARSFGFGLLVIQPVL